MTEADPFPQPRPTPRDAAAANGATHGGGTRGYPWKRALLAIGFLFVSVAVWWIVLFAAIAQFVLRAFDERASEDLRRFVRGLGAYFAHIAEYVTLGRDDAPFPIGPWPRT